MSPELLVIGVGAAKEGSAGKDDKFHTIYHFALRRSGIHGFPNAKPVLELAVFPNSESWFLLILGGKKKLNDQS